MRPAPFDSHRTSCLHNHSPDCLLSQPNSPPVCVYPERDLVALTTCLCLPLCCVVSSAILSGTENGMQVTVGQVAWTGTVWQTTPTIRLNWLLTL